MKNELLRIGPFTIYGYGLMIAIGILAAYFTGEYRAKKRKLPYEHVFYLVIWPYSAPQFLIWYCQF